MALNRLGTLAVGISADPSNLQANMKKAEASLNSFKRVSDGAATSAGRSFQRMSRSGGNSLRMLRAGVGQAGFQVADIATQFSMGANKAQVLGIQLGQLAGSFGVVGAVLGSVITLIGVGIGAKQRMAEAANENSKTNNTLISSYKELRSELHRVRGVEHLLEQERRGRNIRFYEQEFKRLAEERKQADEEIKRLQRMQGSFAKTAGESKDERTRTSALQRSRDLERQISNQKDLQRIRIKQIIAAEAALYSAKRIQIEDPDADGSAATVGGVDPLKEAQTKAQEALDQEKARVDAYIQNKKLEIEIDQYAINNKARMAELENSINQARMQSYQNVAQAVMSSTAQGMQALQQMGKEGTAAYKVLFLANQAAGIANAIVSAHVGAAKALELGPIGVPLSKLILATGYMNVAAIAGQTIAGFRQGGYTGGAGVNDVAGVVHGQEFVMDADATRRIGVNNLEALRSGSANMNQMAGKAIVVVQLSDDLQGRIASQEGITARIERTQTNMQRSQMKQGRMS